MKRIKAFLCLLLSLGLVLTLAGCGQQAQEEPEVPTLNISLDGGGWGGFQGKFSPFYASMVTDHQIMELTQLQLLPSDRAGVPVFQGIEGETRSYNGTDYTYYGPADLTITQNADGTVFYDITLREDLTFSDGESVTLEDLIFSLYVLCDPAYCGPSRLGEMPIQGLADYQANYESLSALLFRLGEDNTDFSLVTQQQQTAFWSAVDGPLSELAQNILDLQQAAFEESLTPAEWAEQGGYGTLPQDATVRDMGIFLAEQYDWDFIRLDDWLSQSTYAEAGPLSQRLGEVFTYSSHYVNTGGPEVPRISGLQRTGDYSLRVVADRVEVELLYALSEVGIAPLHHYGEPEQYREDQDSFGFPKGDLSGILDKNAQPLGAGPYVLTSYENQVVTCRANEQYYLGAPKIPQLRLSVPEGYDFFSGLETGRYDLCMAVTSVTFNEMEGVEHLRLPARNCVYYECIILDPQRILVAGDPWSEASRNLRKGIATVIAVCRRPSLEQAVASGVSSGMVQLDDPISGNTWLVPGAEDASYEEAYARDVGGNLIYTEDMTPEQRLEAAQGAALEYFAAAGCTVENGRVTSAPAGTSLNYRVEVFAPQEDQRLLTLQSTAQALAEIGITLEIFNTYELWNMDAEGDQSLPEEQDLWIGGWDAADLMGRTKSAVDWAEWYLVADPDAWLWPVYHTDAGSGSAAQQAYGLSDPELDRLLEEGRSTLDFAARQDCYRQCLERIKDLACEVPLYQEQSQLLFRTEVLNAETLPADMTAHYGWSREIHLLELREE